MFNTGSNLLTKSGLTADQVNALLAGHGDFEGLGSTIIDIEGKYGVNAFWTMAQMTQEVGWSGHSAIADDKRNLFGITAFDSNPYDDASGYNSFADCIEYYGGFLKASYLTPGGAYFVSPTPAGVARHWASDPNYASEVTSIMNIYYGRVKGSPTPPNEPVTTPVPQGGVYVVKAGQNMSVIAGIVGLTLGQLEAMNPTVGHPAGNFNVIWPGDQLHIGAATPPAAPVAPNGPAYVYVSAGQNLSNIATQHGESLATIEELNPSAGHPAGNFDIIWPGDKIRVR